MDLNTVQLVFYTLGIAFMVSLIILVVTLIYVLIQFKNTVDRATEKAREAVDDLKESTVGRIESLITDNRMKIIGGIGMGVVTMLMRKLEAIFGVRRKVD